MGLPVVALYWGPMVSCSWGQTCHHGNWFHRASAWSWFGLVLTSPCSFAVWHAAAHLVESLWLTWRDSHCRTGLASLLLVVAVRYLPGSYLNVWCTYSGLFLSRVTLLLFAQAGQCLHVSYVTAASIRQLLRVLSLGEESLGVKINAGAPEGDGQLGHVHQYVSGTRAARQECCQSTSNACGVPGHVHQDGRGQQPVQTAGATAAAPRERKYFYREIKALLAWLL